MIIVFRVDASMQIGTGHVMRCLTLAEALKNRGNNIMFICRKLDNNYCSLIEDRGFTVFWLPRSKLSEEHREDSSLLAHSSWLGSTWQEDAEQTLNVISALGEKPEWIIVDHYALDFRWESALREKASRIMVIDDIADREHDCNLILDQNLVNNMQSRYCEKLPNNCIRLFGPTYSLLQPEYEKLSSRIPPRVGVPKRMLVYFGGADIDNLTGLCIDAFLTLHRNDVDVDVVVSLNNPYEETIRQKIKDTKNIKLYSDMKTLASLMSKADLAIGAGGATSWERCCLGLPTLVITLAENQYSIAQELHDRGLIKWLGHKSDIESVQIAKELNDIFDVGLDKSWSLECKKIVDGKGVLRVCDVLHLDNNTPLRARHAIFDDSKLLSAWSSMSPALVDDKIGNQWFINALRDVDSCSIYFIETCNATPIAYVHIKNINGACTVCCELSRIGLGGGIENEILKVALTKYRAEQSGEIMFNNYHFRDFRSNNERISRRITSELQLSISLCSDKDSWINKYLVVLMMDLINAGHNVSWSHNANDLTGGDICFYLSYGSIVTKEILSKFKNNLVVHESDLPKGKGWSPMTWQILECESQIPVSLFEASISVDSGPIYMQEVINLQGDELVDEWRSLQAATTNNLCLKFVNNYPDVLDKSRMQYGEASYYPLRTDKDSKLNMDKTVREQFELLRVVDNDKYPAWFEINNKKFELKIVKR